MKENFNANLVNRIYRSSRISFIRSMNYEKWRKVYITDRLQLLPMPLEQKIDRLCSLYKELQLYAKMNSKFFSLIAPLWFLISIMQLVGDIYAIVKFELFRSKFFISLSTRTLTVYFILSVFLRTIDDLAQQKDRIRSFIYKFPISKLDEIQMQKVEMFCNVISNHNPIINISDIYYLHGRMIPPVSTNEL
ncbi:hypothetical protein WA026_013212 [Henosepilachna vigintioctopunctata]|uniref:Gustatory receptor n=1 Tax=Henosepilachna vigintioctopunctata TaxID=420089 RepID=A0AAW1UJL3_9CUCU